MGDTLKNIFNNRNIITSMFIIGAVVMGIYDMSGYGWLIFGAFLSADL